MQGLGIGATFGSSLPEQDDAVIVSQRQRALKKQDNRRVSRPVFSLRFNFKPLLKSSSNDNKIDVTGDEKSLLRG